MPPWPVAAHTPVCTTGLRVQSATAWAPPVSMGMTTAPVKARQTANWFCGALRQRSGQHKSMPVSIRQAASCVESFLDWCLVCSAWRCLEPGTLLRFEPAIQGACWKWLPDTRDHARSSEMAGHSYQLRSS